MTDPDIGHGFLFTDDGLVDIDNSPFFDIGFGDDHTVEEYANRILFPLSESLEERLGINGYQLKNFPDAPLHPSYGALKSLYRADPVPESPTTTNDDPDLPSGAPTMYDCLRFLFLLVASLVFYLFFLLNLVDKRV